jgi:hypothetical protein
MRMRVKEIARRKEAWMGLAVVVALAGLVISRMTPSTEVAKGNRNHTGVAVERKGEEIYRLGSPGDYSYISSRDLFRPLVEPPKQEPPKVQEPKKKEEEKPKPSPPDPTSDLILTGIINMSDGKRAIIENRQGTEGHYVREGEMVRGMKVLEIGENYVALEKSDGSRAELRLGAGQKVVKAESQAPREQQAAPPPPPMAFPGQAIQIQMGSGAGESQRRQFRQFQPPNIDEIVRRMRERGMSEEEIRDRIQRFMERRQMGGEGAGAPPMPGPR